MFQLWLAIPDGKWRVSFVGKRRMNSTLKVKLSIWELQQHCQIIMIVIFINRLNFQASWEISDLVSMRPQFSQAWRATLREVSHCKSAGLRHYNGSSRGEKCGSCGWAVKQQGREGVKLIFPGRSEHFFLTGPLSQYLSSTQAGVA